MMCESRHCEDCGYFLPFGKVDAAMVCNALSHVGAWNRYRKQVIVAVALAIKQFGICAYRTELVDKLGIPCDEIFDKDG